MHDAHELVRWADTYGHPEEWAKKAQSLWAENERLRRGLNEIASIDLRAYRGSTEFELGRAVGIAQRLLEQRATLDEGKSNG